MVTRSRWWRGVKIKYGLSAMARRHIAAPTPRILSVSQAAAEECPRILDETSALETLANYGERLKTGISLVLNARAIVHSYTGHPSMLGLFFTETPPDNCRAWKARDDSFYDHMTCFPHDLGVIVVPDSR